MSLDTSTGTICHGSSLPGIGIGIGMGIGIGTVLIWLVRRIIDGLFPGNGSAVSWRYWMLDVGWKEDCMFGHTIYYNLEYCVWE